MKLALATVAVLVVSLGEPALAQDAPPPASAHDRAEALNEIGREKVRVLDFSAAADSFRGAIALDPDPRYYFNLCFVLEKLGELAEARAACDVVVNARTDDCLASKARERIASIDAAGAGAAVEAPGAVDDSPDGAAASEPPAPIAPFERPEPAVRFGLVVGVASTTVAADGDDDYDRKVGVVIGGRVVGRLVGPLSLVAELELVNRGAKVEFTELGLASGTIDSSYLEVPLLARLTLGDAVRGFVEGGGGVAILVDDSVELDGMTGDAEVETIDLSIIAGAGIAVETDWGVAGLSLRMWHGLRDLGDRGEQLRNRAFGVLASASF